MTVFDAIIIAVIEGLTEFLPVSSTGHMIVASSFLGLEQDEVLKSFQVVIQFAAVVAVVLYYRSTLLFSKQSWMLVGVGALPILIAGYLLADIVKELFAVEVVAGAFIVGGVVFLLTEYWYTKKPDKVKVDDVKDLSVKQALIVGVLQIVSLIPGTSRSGATIIGGLWSGFSRKVAAEFSFLLAVPVLTVVTVYDLLQTPDLFSGQNTVNLIVGFVVACIIALGALHVFVQFIGRYSFRVFGWYRIILGIVLFIFYL